MENHEMISMLNDHDHAAIHGSTITFSAINYSVVAQQDGSSCFDGCCQQKPKQILYDLSGVFKPGINAILGPTGSGKSSLLDILAGRKDRQGLTGSVLMNGQPQSDDYKYRVGYVVQDDMISGMLTVQENLTFSANVRLPRNVTYEEKLVIVRRVIGQLELEKCANTRVGTENIRGVSGGERRRTNIGMELVLSPTVLFLDEPTTGTPWFCSHPQELSRLLSICCRSRLIDCAECNRVLGSIIEERTSVANIINVTLLLCSPLQTRSSFPSINLATRSSNSSSIFSSSRPVIVSTMVRRARC